MIGTIEPPRGIARFVNIAALLIYEPHSGYFVVELNLDELIEINRLSAR